MTLVSAKSSRLVCLVLLRVFGIVADVIISVLVDNGDYGL